LRYLELGGQLETELLQEIGNLKLLKTLVLWQAEIKALPSSIFQLRQLEHMIIHNRCVKLLNGIGNLTSLQTLFFVRGEDWPHNLAEIDNLTELRMLSLYRLESRCEENTKIFLQSLSNLCNLHTLKFIGKKRRTCSLDCIPDQWRGPAHLQNFSGFSICFSQVPLWFSSLSELSVLSIIVMNLGQDHLLFGM
jgi:hypothetical protein